MHFNIDGEFLEECYHKMMPEDTFASLLGSMKVKILSISDSSVQHPGETGKSSTKTQ